MRWSTEKDSDCGHMRMPLASWQSHWKNLPFGNRMSQWCSRRDYHYDIEPLLGNYYNNCQSDWRDSSKSCRFLVEYYVAMQNHSYPLERLLQCLRIDFDIMWHRCKLLVNASHNVIQFEEYELPHLNEWKIQLTVVLGLSIMLEKITVLSSFTHSRVLPNQIFSFFDILFFC